MHHSNLSKEEVFKYSRKQVDLLPITYSGVARGNKLRETEKERQETISEKKWKPFEFKASEINRLIF